MMVVPCVARCRCTATRSSTVYREPPVAVAASYAAHHICDVQTSHRGSHRPRRWRWRTLQSLGVIMVLVFICSFTTVRCQQDEAANDVLMRNQNPRRRGMLPGLLGGKKTKRLPANQAAKVEDNGPAPANGKPEPVRRPMMPPQQPKVRYEVNPWQDTQKYTYKWPENQRAYFTCPRGYFIASLEPKFGMTQTSVLRIPWSSKATLFTLKDKFQKGLSLTESEKVYPKFAAPKLTKEQQKSKQFEEVVMGPKDKDVNALTLTGCDPVLQCLGHQSCLFKISVELCAADPSPGNRKVFSISVSCAKDSMESDYATTTEELATARKERDHLLYIAYDSSQSSESQAHIDFHQLSENEIFEVDCPLVEESLQNGYGGWCTNPPPSQPDIADDLWNILGRVPFAECRKELREVYCAYHYNNTGGCLPPTYIEPRKEGQVPKLGEVDFSFNAFPKKGDRPDMAKHEQLISSKHADLVACKLGILILAHANAEAVAQLLKGVYRKHHFYVIHVDYRADSVRDHLVTKAAELAGDLDNVHVLPKSRSFIASWGSYDIVRAEIEGYEELLRMGVWDFVINLSGADLPLRDIDDVGAMLAAYRSYNFMRQNGNWNDRSGKATDYTVWYGCGGHVYNISRRGQRPAWTDMHSASQWAVLNRKYIDYLLDVKKRSDKLNALQFYAMTCIIPDESYIMSMMKISPFRNTFIHANFHHLKAFARRDDKGFCRHTDDIDFCGQGPGTMVSTDSNNLHLMAHNFFFSRKYQGDPRERARMTALELANGEHYEDLHKQFIKPALKRQLVEMVMEEQYGENWMNEAEVMEILKIRVFPQVVTLDPCCLPIYTTKNQLSRDTKYWIDFSMFEQATQTVRVLRASFIPQSRTNCFTKGHLKALYMTAVITNDRKVPVKQVNIIPHEIAGGKQLNLVTYVNRNENIAKADGCNEIENLPDDSFDHRNPDSFTYVRYPDGEAPTLHFNASLINDIGEVKCFLEVVITFKKPHPTVQKSDTVRFINTINCGPLTSGFWTIVLFQKRVKNPFPYTTQVYLAEDNGLSDWSEFSMNDALYGLWLIEDVKQLVDNEYPGVAKARQPIFHDPSSEDRPEEEAGRVRPKKPAVGGDQADPAKGSESSSDQDKDETSAKDDNDKGANNDRNEGKLFVAGKEESPVAQRRVKLRESLQRGLVDGPLRLSENNRDDVGGRHAMGHHEGSYLRLAKDKTRAHFKGWRHQPFSVILVEFLLISTVLFVFTRIVLVPMRLVKRRSSGFRSFLTFLLAVTLLQVVLFTLFNLYAS